MDSTFSIYSELISRTTLGLEAFILLFVAFMFKAMIVHRGYAKQIHKLTTDDNLASALDLSAYLFAVLLALLDSLAIEGTSLIVQGSEVAYIGISIIIMLELSQQLTDRILFKGISVQEQIQEHGNLALALARGALVVAMSMMVRGVLAHPQPWLTLAPWLIIGVLCIALLGAFFQWLTPYDDLAEIGQGNHAAALPLAGAWLASGITVESAITGESTDLISELFSVSAYLVLAALVLIGVRFCLRSFFFRGIDLNHEITQDKNAGIGLIEAVLYLCVAEVTCFFLS